MENNKIKNCQICNKELSQEEVNSIEFTDTIITCGEHRKYRSYGNCQIPKMELGIITEYPEKWKKCAICECHLLQDDLDSFVKDTFNPTCKKHRISHNYFQLDVAKEWFEYCDYVGFDLNYSEQNFMKFQEWRREKYNNKN